MATPSPPLQTYMTRPLTLSYTVPTDQFICESYPSTLHNVWTYVADITVEEQPDYPEISETVWIVALAVGDGSGIVSASVYPKGPQASAKSADCPSALMVDFRVRSNDCGPSDVRIGPSGWCRTGCDSLAGLAVSYAGFCGHCHYYLCKGSFVHVTLMFYVDQLKTSPRERTDMKQLLESGTMADCVLICDGLAIPVHRAILAARSPVFAAMWEKEQKGTSVCKVDDIGRNILEILLEFAYTRAPLEADGQLQEVWDAANKYEMEDLRIECERMMLEDIRADTAIRYLCFAREHGLNKLQTAAAKFIGQHPLDV